MARIEIHPKVILTQEEIKILEKAEDIIHEIAYYDSDGDVFDKVENDDSNLFWLSTAIEKLIEISEVE